VTAGGPGRLAGRVAVVTGAGQGVGRGIARRFAREGAAVTVAEIDAARGEAVAAELAALGAKSLFVPTDVSRRDAVEAMVGATVDRFGGLDILVSNAQWVSDKVPLEDKTDEMLAGTLGSGLWATFWAMQAALPHLRERGGGRVINLCSLIGRTGQPGYADYAATKEAIAGLTRVAANEWARDGILVNAIAPVARTPAVDRYAVDHPEAVRAAEQANPLGRLGDPEDDIGGVALFLASDDARYVTGVTIDVDGGAHLRPNAP
jgi:NAD(P)-dependent dehydrogenase (short-subunit alcohol dehydrogenase family)